MSTLHALRSRVAGPLNAGVLPSGASIEMAWQHVREGLKALASNGRTDLAELSENALTQLLMDELNGGEGYAPFFFDKESLRELDNGNSPRVDITVKPKKEQIIVVHGNEYAFATSFLALEAKRLPTLGTDRKKEYLTGDAGGVERFKRGKHGPGLKEVGLIGYVQKKSFEYWRNQINQWVDELLKTPPTDLVVWDAHDRLILEKESERLAEHRSRSIRGTDNQLLEIRHLWVQLAHGSSMSTANTP